MSIITDLLRWFLGNAEGLPRKRVFISFAMEDKPFRDHLVNQAKQERTPFHFVDMSVKKPWNQNIWKKRCRSKIKGCDGVIVLLSKNTYHAGGARWEMKCANEEGVPMVGMHAKKNDRGTRPPELNGKRVIIWTWKNLERVIDSF